MRKCAECARRRTAARSVVFATISTVLFMSWNSIVAWRRGIPTLELVLRQLTSTVLLFSLLYLSWGWIDHYRHEARPRTRYVLTRLAWYALLVAVGLAVSALTATFLPLPVSTD